MIMIFTLMTLYLDLDLMRLNVVFNPFSGLVNLMIRRSDDQTIQ